jgi:predicted nucleic acid-binding protein
MVDEFYFDTSIWLDFYEKRGKNGENAFNLIQKIIKNDLKIAYSVLNVKEFKNLGYNQESINAIFSIAKPDNIKPIHVYREQLEEARKISRQRKIPNKDALHAILARDNNLQLIAIDKHYEQLKDITEAKKPKDFI